MTLHFILTESQTPTVASTVLEIWFHPLVFPSHLSPSFLWMIPYPLPLTHILVFLSCHKHPRYILAPDICSFCFLYWDALSPKSQLFASSFSKGLYLYAMFSLRPSLIIWFKIWPFLHTPDLFFSIILPPHILTFLFIYLFSIVWLFTECNPFAASPEVHHCLTHEKGQQ